MNKRSIQERLSDTDIYDGVVTYQNPYILECEVKMDFKFYAKYIMQNARLDEAQAGIKISRKNINNLRYADYTTLMAERKKELKGLLVKVKEKNEKAGLKLNIQTIQIMASGPITSWQIEEVEAVTGLIFLGSKITENSDCIHKIKRHLLLGMKPITNLDIVLK